jgi:choline dehydrogenase-like flavoprotein
MAAADRDRGSETADICIVGAGPVGLALAFKLEKLGLDVTLLEMGADGAAIALNAGNIEFQNAHHAPSLAMSRPGIGGASALWGGRCVAFDDLDFEKRGHVPFSGWPLPHETLRPYYPEAFSFLNCGPTQTVSEKLCIADASISTEAIERWSRQPDLGAESARRLNDSRRIRLVNGRATGIRLDSSGGRVECIRVHRDGEEMHVAARNFVLAGGGLENARLLLSLQRDRSEFGGGSDGPTGRFYQGHLTGYIALLHFEKPAMARQFAFQLDDQGYIVRRRFQVSTAVQLKERLLNCVFWLDAVSIADPIHGSGSLSLVYLFLKALGLYRRLSNGLAPTSRGAQNINRREHWRNIVTDRRWLIDLFGVLQNMGQRRRNRWRILINPKGRYLLRYHAEQVPNPESRVFLKANGQQPQSDALAVDYRVTDQDLSSVLRSHEILDEWLRRNGLGRLEYLHDPEERRQAVLNQAFDGYHQIGLSRMAATPAEGVADADCRVHGVANLYLAGSCLFPTGGHANPTLPAVALALRLADHLKDQSAAAPNC